MRTSWVLPDFRFSAMTSDLERFTLSDRRFNDLKNDSCTLSTAPRLGGGPISVFGSAVGAAVVTHFEAALNIVTVFFSTSYGDGRDKRHDKSLFNDKRKRRKKKKHQTTTDRLSANDRPGIRSVLTTAKRVWRCDANAVKCASDDESGPTVCHVAAAGRVTILLSCASRYPAALPGNRCSGRRGRMRRATAADPAIVSGKGKKRKKLETK